MPDAGNQEDPSRARRPTALESDLDRIEKLIERMAKNSFVIKGWTITLMTGLLAFGKRDVTVGWAALRLVPAMTFWALDAYYLSLEKAFCALYAKKLDGSDQTRSLAPPPGNWLKASTRPAVLLVYVPIIVVIFVILLAG